VNALRAAFAYFSILPAGFAGAPRSREFALLPLVGVAIGGLAGAAGRLSAFVLPAPLAVVVAFALSVVLSGAIHVDGLLDVADALFASVPRERRLEILKDPHHGTYALAALGIAVPAWLGAIAAIPAPAWPWAFAFCAGIARAAAVLNAYRFPYAGERPNAVLLLVAAVGAGACCWPHPRLVLLAVPAAVLALALGAWCARRLGGVLVGDCYGAVIVVLEIVLLAGVAVALR
jgi:adenosylcobinamide-GDP ribazoletransferase